MKFPRHSPLRLFVLVLWLVSCKGDSDSATDTVNTDETDTDPTCDPIARRDFGSQANQICMFYAGCDDPPWGTMEECLEYLRIRWDNFACWDECLAWECSVWLSTSPTCADAETDLLAACTAIPICPG